MGAEWPSPKFRVKLGAEEEWMLAFRQLRYFH